MALLPLLAAPMDTGSTWAEEVIAGLEVTLIGMLVVFSVLILLFVLLTLLGRFAGEARPDSLGAQVAEEDAPQPEAPSAQTLDAQVVPVAPAAPDAGELVAVIAAALAAATAPEQTAAAPVARQTTRPTRASWAMAGRMDQAVTRANWREGRGS